MSTQASPVMGDDIDQRPQDEIAADLNRGEQGKPSLRQVTPLEHAAEVLRQEKTLGDSKATAIVALKEELQRLTEIYQIDAGEIISALRNFGISIEVSTAKFDFEPPAPKSIAFPQQPKPETVERDTVPVTPRGRKRKDAPRDAPISDPPAVPTKRRGRPPGSKNKK